MNRIQIQAEERQMKLKAAKIKDKLQKESRIKSQCLTKVKISDFCENKSTLNGRIIYNLPFNENRTIIFQQKHEEKTYMESWK